ncbi:hypothetical protein Plhal304r1_c010g0040351 [Plasmopara halstedii]
MSCSRHLYIYLHFIMVQNPNNGKGAKVWKSEDFAINNVKPASTMPTDDRNADVSLLIYHEENQTTSSVSRIDNFSQVPQRPRGLSASIVSIKTVSESPTDRRIHLLGRQNSMPVMSIKSQRRRKVTFKNIDIVPPPKVVSYDELVFNVAGLFHTMSFLHDREDWGDDPADCGLKAAFYEPEPLLERSVPLMIAEFLYRSAIYLGYPQGDTPWLPAHFDWEAEEREFSKNHRKAPPLTSLQARTDRSESIESNGNTSVMSTIGTSFRIRSDESVDSVSSKSRQQSPEYQKSGKSKLHIPNWFRKHRRPQCEESDDLSDSSESGKRKPVSWLNPPPIPLSRDLKLLVDIVNSCVYCGQYQFRKRDIVRLCNVKI